MGIIGAGYGLALGPLVGQLGPAQVGIAGGQAGVFIVDPLKRLILTPFCKYIIINNDNNSLI